MRVIAQRTRTGEFLDWDVPVSNLSITWKYSGGQSINGTIPVEFAHLMHRPDGMKVLEEWATTLYLEDDDNGEILGGALFEKASYSGPQLTLETRGFAAYPQGIPYEGHFKQTSIETLAAVREMWRWMQSQQGGNLGLQVDQTTMTGVLLGNEVNEEKKKEPYLLEPWDNVDCGQEIDKLAGATPFGYRELHRWNALKTDVEHFLRFGHPHLGVKRQGLQFIQGENVRGVITPSFEGDTYANAAIGLGKGEGAKMTRVTVANSTRKIRRVATFKDETVGDAKMLLKMTQNELKLYRDPIVITDVVVDAFHRNAPLTSYMEGDAVFVEAEIPHLGEYRGWNVITQKTYNVSAGTVSLSVEPADRFPITGVG